MTSDQVLEELRVQDAVNESQGVARTWLIVGHGTVGYTLAERVLDGGGRVFIRDDDPRVAPCDHARVTMVDDAAHVAADFVALCVPSSVARAAADHVLVHTLGEPLIFDWASAPPATKAATAGNQKDTFIDVALLDSLDRPVDRPLLAISGAQASRGATALEALDFEVAIAGGGVGDAASVKITRSLFMKPLEALVVEFRSIAESLDPSGSAWRSIQNNLGPMFADFADVLVTSDVTHAGRRTPELENALTHARTENCSPLVAHAAVVALGRLADHWSGADLPVGASVADILTSARSVFETVVTG